MMLLIEGLQILIIKFLLFFVYLSCGFNDLLLVCFISFGVGVGGFVDEVSLMGVFVSFCVVRKNEEIKGWGIWPHMYALSNSQEMD